MTGIKRTLRCLKKHPRGLSFYQWDNDEKLLVHTDSDWAGDRTTRKSVSGGCIFNGTHLIGHWSKTQSNVALSSGEAEMNAAVKGMSEMIGLSELFVEMQGESIQQEIFLDANACKGMILRRGAGKVKHLAVKQLWIQEALELHGVKVRKIPREENVADAFTHLLPKIQLEKFMRKIAFQVR